MSAQAHMTSTRAKIAAVESASSALQAELEGTATALAAAKTAPARAELLERIEAAENNCARLRRMTMALHYALKHNSQLTMDAHEDVEHTLRLLKSKATELDHTYTTINELRKQIALLSEDLGSAHSALGQSHARVTEMKLKVQSADAVIEEQQDTIEELEAALRNKMKLAEAKMALVRSKLVAAQEQQRDMTDDEKDLAAFGRKVQAGKDAAAAEEARLNKVAADLKAQRVEGRKRAASLAAAKAKLIARALEVHNEMKKLQSEMAQMEDLSPAIRNALAKQTAEAQRLNSLASQAKARAEAAAVALASARKGGVLGSVDAALVKRLEARLVKDQATLAKAEEDSEVAAHNLKTQQLAALDSAGDSQKSKALLDKMTALQAKLTASQKEEAEAEEALDDQKRRNREAKAVRAKAFAQLQRDRAKAASRAAQLVAEARALEAAKQQQRAKQNALNKLRADAEKASTKLGATQTALEASKQDLAAKKAALTAAQAQAAKAKTDLAAMLKALESGTQNTMKAGEDAFSQSLKALNDKLEALKKARAAEKSQLELLKVKNAALVASAKKRMAASKLNKAELESYDKEIGLKDAQISNLLKERVKMLTSIKAMNAKMDLYTDRVVELKVRAAESGSKMTAMQAQLAQGKALQSHQLSYLMARFKELIEENDEQSEVISRTIRLRDHAYAAITSMAEQLQHQKLDEDRLHAAYEALKKQHASTLADAAEDQKEAIQAAQAKQMAAMKAAQAKLAKELAKVRAQVNDSLGKALKAGKGDVVATATALAQTIAQQGTAIKNAQATVATMSAAMDQMRSQRDKLMDQVSEMTTLLTQRQQQIDAVKAKLVAQKTKSLTDLFMTHPANGAKAGSMTSGLSAQDEVLAAKMKALKAFNGDGSLTASAVVVALAARLKAQQGQVATIKAALQRALSVSASGKQDDMSQEALNAALAQKSAQVEALRAVLAEDDGTDKQTKAWKKELKSLTTELTLLQIRLRMQAAAAKEGTDKEKLKAMLQQIRAQDGALVAMRTSLNQKIAMLTGKLQATQAKLRSVNGDVKEQTKEDSMEEAAQKTALTARDEEIARLKAQLARSSSKASELTDKLHMVMDHVDKHDHSAHELLNSISKEARARIEQLKEKMHTMRLTYENRMVNSDKAWQAKLVDADKVWQAKMRSSWKRVEQLQVLLDKRQAKVQELQTMLPELKFKLAKQEAVQHAFEDKLKKREAAYADLSEVAQERVEGLREKLRDTLQDAAKHERQQERIIKELHGKSAKLTAALEALKSSDAKKDVKVSTAQAKLQARLAAAQEELTDRAANLRKAKEDKRALQQALDNQAKALRNRELDIVSQNRHVKELESNLVRAEKDAMLARRGLRKAMSTSANAELMAQLKTMRARLVRLRKHTQSVEARVATLTKAHSDLEKAMGALSANGKAQAAHALQLASKDAAIQVLLRQRDNQAHRALKYTRQADALKAALAAQNGLLESLKAKIANGSASADDKKMLPLLTSRAEKMAQEEADARNRVAAVQKQVDDWDSKVAAAKVEYSAVMAKEVDAKAAATAAERTVAERAAAVQKAELVAVLGVESSRLASLQRDLTAASKDKARTSSKLKALQLEYGKLVESSKSASVNLRQAKRDLAAAVAKTAKLQKKLDADEVKVRVLENQNRALRRQVQKDSKFLSNLRAERRHDEDMAKENDTLRRKATSATAAKEDAEFKLKSLQDGEQARLATLRAQHDAWRAKAQASQKAYEAAKKDGSVTSKTIAELKATHERDMVAVGSTKLLLDAEHRRVKALQKERDGLRHKADRLSKKVLALTASLNALKASTGEINMDRTKLTAAKKMLRLKEAQDHKDMLVMQSQLDALRRKASALKVTVTELTETKASMAEAARHDRAALIKMRNEFRAMKAAHAQRRKLTLATIANLRRALKANAAAIVALSKQRSGIASQAGSHAQAFATQLASTQQDHTSALRAMRKSMEATIAALKKAHAKKLKEAQQALLTKAKESISRIQSSSSTDAAALAAKDKEIAAIRHQLTLALRKVKVEHSEDKLKVKVAKVVKSHKAEMVKAEVKHTKVVHKMQKMSKSTLQSLRQQAIEKDKAIAAAQQKLTQTLMQLAAVKASRKSLKAKFEAQSMRLKREQIAVSVSRRMLKKWSVEKKLLQSKMARQSQLVARAKIAVAAQVAQANAKIIAARRRMADLKSQSSMSKAEAGKLKAKLRQAIKAVERTKELEVRKHLKLVQKLMALKAQQRRADKKWSKALEDAKKRLRQSAVTAKKWQRMVKKLKKTAAKAQERMASVVKGARAAKNEARSAKMRAALAEKQLNKVAEKMITIGGKNKKRAGTLLEAESFTVTEAEADAMAAAAAAKDALRLRLAKVTAEETITIRSVSTTDASVTVDAKKARAPTKAQDIPAEVATLLSLKKRPQPKDAAHMTAAEWAVDINWQRSAATAFNVLESMLGKPATWDKATFKAYVRWMTDLGIQLDTQGCSFKAFLAGQGCPFRAPKKSAQKAGNQVVVKLRLRKAKTGKAAKKSLEVKDLPASTRKLLLVGPRPQPFDEDMMTAAEWKAEMAWQSQVYSAWQALSMLLGKASGWPASYRTAYKTWFDDFQAELKDYDCSLKQFVAKHTCPMTRVDREAAQEQEAWIKGAGSRKRAAQAAKQAKKVKHAMQAVSKAAQHLKRAKKALTDVQAVAAALKRKNASAKAQAAAAKKVKAAEVKVARAQSFVQAAKAIQAMALNKATKVGGKKASGNKVSKKAAAKQAAARKAAAQKATQALAKAKAAEKKARMALRAAKSTASKKAAKKALAKAQARVAKAQKGAKKAWNAVKKAAARAKKAAQPKKSALDKAIAAAAKVPVHKAQQKPLSKKQCKQVTAEASAELKAAAKAYTSANTHLQIRVRANEQAKMYVSLAEKQGGEIAARAREAQRKTERKFKLAKLIAVKAQTALTVAQIKVNDGCKTEDEVKKSVAAQVQKTSNTAAAAQAKLAQAKKAEVQAQSKLTTAERNLSTIKKAAKTSKAAKKALPKAEADVKSASKVVAQAKKVVAKQTKQAQKAQAALDQVQGRALAMGLDPQIKTAITDVTSKFVQQTTKDRQSAAEKLAKALLALAKFNQKDDPDTLAYDRQEKALIGKAKRAEQRYFSAKLMYQTAKEAHKRALRGSDGMVAAAEAKAKAAKAKAEAKAMVAAAQAAVVKAVADAQKAKMLRLVKVVADAQKAKLLREAPAANPQAELKKATATYQAAEQALAKGKKDDVDNKNKQEMAELKAAVNAAKLKVLKAGTAVRIVQETKKLASGDAAVAEAAADKKRADADASAATMKLIKAKQAVVTAVAAVGAARVAHVQARADASLAAPAQAKAMATRVTATRKTLNKARTVFQAKQAEEKKARKVATEAQAKAKRASAKLTKLVTLTLSAKEAKAIAEATAKAEKAAARVLSKASKQLRRFAKKTALAKANKTTDAKLMALLHAKQAAQAAFVKATKAAAKSRQQAHDLLLKKKYGKKGTATVHAEAKARQAAAAKRNAAQAAAAAALALAKGKKDDEDRKNKSEMKELAAAAAKAQAALAKATAADAAAAKELQVRQQAQQAAYRANVAKTRAYIADQLETLGFPWNPKLQDPLNPTKVEQQQLDLWAHQVDHEFEVRSKLRGTKQSAPLAAMHKAWNSDWRFFQIPRNYVPNHPHHHNPVPGN